MSTAVKILMIEFVTHDVKRFILEKPRDLKFTPGQAIDISINTPGWSDATRPFTFTCKQDDLVLEFTIKGYKERNGVTKELYSLHPGDELLLHKPFGTINYKGPGVFLAAGTGVTPFIAILRDLRDSGKLNGNSLIFSNKAKKDVILEAEWREMFDPNHLILTLTREQHPEYEYGRVDEKLLSKYMIDLGSHVYICGPDPFVAAMKELVVKMGGDPEGLVFEE
jgi:ferredoxin-NADP reductase